MGDELNSGNDAGMNSTAATPEQTLQQAVVLYQAGQSEEAAKRCLSILETQPGHAGANHMMGVMAVQLQQHAAALSYLMAALEADPACGQYWLSYINALFQAGQLEAAREVLTLARKQGLTGDQVEALAAQLDGDTRTAEQPEAVPVPEQQPAPPDNAPDQQEVNTLLALFNAGQLKEAEMLAHELTMRFPRYGFGWLVLGTVLKQMGRSAEALAPMQKAVLLLPENANAYGNLGAIFQDLGRFAEAEACNRKAIQLNPDNPQIYSNLGFTLQSMGRLEESEMALRQAIQLKPDFAEAYNNLGNTLKGMKRLDEAIASYQKAIQISPDHALAHYNLGVTFQDSGRMEEAEVSYRQAVQLNPDNAVAYNNLSIPLQALGRLDEAEACCRRALQINPKYADAYINLGATLMALGRPPEAEACYRQVLEDNPGNALAYNNLGATLQDLGQLDDATDCFRRALEIKPDFSDANGNLLFALNYHPDLRAEEIYRAYQEYDALRGIPFRSTWRPHNNNKNPGRRLRIGYVSPDFRHHSCRYFLEPLLAHHDKTQVEVYAYAELTREDYMSARYRNYVDHWIPTWGMSNEALAERIRSDGIDILVELAGHTSGNRLLAFARKPAPVSLSWLGYGYTTGLSAIDYYLTDEASVPAGSEGLFAERPWRIAVPAYAYRPAADMGEVNSLPAQQRGYITFGTLTRSIRINHRTIRVWSDILNAVPHSRLVIDSLNFKEPAMQEQMAASFAQHGISCDRLEIGFHSPPWDVLRSIDIGLDCFPHNSGTTLFETLYMGVPYITLAGRPSVGRLGSSILHAAGHPEWIAQSEDSYAAKAVELASDITRLSRIRSALRDQIESSPLRDEKGFARKVEDAYRQMWVIWCKKGGSL